MKLNRFFWTKIEFVMWCMIIIASLLILFTVAAMNSEQWAFSRIGITFGDPIERPRYTQFLNQSLNDFESDFKNRLIKLDIILFILSAFGAYILAGKTLEPIEKMVDEQESFAAEMSHQLRTPLTIMKVDLSALLKDRDSIGLSARATIVSSLEEIERMRKIVDGLLWLVRPINSQRRLININEAVTDAISIYLKTPEFKKRVVLDIDPELSVDVDRDQFIQMIRILVENGLKYSTGNVIVRTKTVSNRIVIFVSDSGEGIQKEDLPFIFDRFYRGVNVKSAGSGLGLAILKRLVEANGARITATSSKNRGTTFSIWI